MGAWCPWIFCNTGLGKTDGFCFLTRVMFFAQCYGCMQEKVCFGSFLPMKSNVLLFIVRRQFLLFNVDNCCVLCTVIYSFSTNGKLKRKNPKKSNCACLRNDKFFVIIEGYIEGGQHRNEKKTCTQVLLLLLHICCLLFVWIKLIRLISAYVRLMFLWYWHKSICPCFSIEGWGAHYTEMKLISNNI